MMPYRRNEMTYQEQVWQWEETLSRHLPPLSKPQVSALACWSYALITLKTAGQTQVSTWLALMLGGKVGAWRQRLREWCYERSAKKGAQRQEVVVQACFAALLRWLLSWWDAQERRLVLVLDASALGERLTVLSVSVVYRGAAIPVGWHLRRSGARGAWEPVWEGLLRQVAQAVPADWQVLVMADRGLFSRELYRAICGQGWHPFLRLSARGMVRQRGRDDYQPLTSLLPSEPGAIWRGRVVCFQRERQFETTLLVAQAAGYEQAWVVVTDLAEQQSELAWYALRFWIEVGFKQFKRGGWQWQHSKMTQPQRVERYWLVLVVALLWAVSMGQYGEQALPTSSLEHLPPTHVARRTATGRVQPAALSQLTLGRLWLLRIMIQAEAIPGGHFAPLPWPQHLPTPQRRRKRQGQKKSQAQRRRWQRQRRARNKQEGKTG
jgi:DDE family transposase